MSVLRRDVDPGHPGPARAWRWTSVATVLVVLVAAAPSLPPGVTNWDNVVKLQLAKSLLRGDGLVLAGLTPDDGQYVLLGRDGRRYSGYLPLAAALHVVTVQVALLTGFEGEGVPQLLVLALLAAALVSWARRARAPPVAAAAGAMLACFGTALWPMAAWGYDVLVEALALALLLRAGEGEERGRGQWLLAGMAVGAAFATRLGAVVLGFPALALVLAVRPAGVRAAVRRASAIAAGAAPGVLVVLWYNFQRFGSPFVVSRTTGLGAVDQLGAPWFSLLHLEGVVGLLLSPGKGLFWYAPPMVLVAAAAPALARRHRPAALALGAWACAALLLFGRFRFWHGDWGWGPRYLAPLLVAAAPLAWWIVERVSAAGVRARLAAAGALVLAVALQAAPVIGRPVVYHFALVVGPLAQQGRLTTQPMTRPPGPEDYGVHYFEARNSMLVSLARGLARAAEREGFWKRVARALVVPLAAAALVGAAARRTRAAERRPMALGT